MNSREQIGAAIVSLRREAGLTQQQLADHIELSRPAVANIEAGRQGLMLDTLAAIAAALGVSVSQLLGEEPGVGVPLALLTKVAGGQRSITKLLAELSEVVHALAEASERHEKLLAERTEEADCG